MKKGASILFTIVFILSLAACGSNSKPSVEVKQVNTGLVIEYDTNILFNIYEIRIIANGTVIGDQKQGEKKLYEITLPEGSSTVTFSQIGKDTNKTSATVSVSDGSYYYFFIKAKNGGITIDRKDTMSLGEVYAIVGAPTDSVAGNASVDKGNKETPADSPSPDSGQSTNEPIEEDNSNSISEPTIFDINGEYLDLDVINNTNSSEDDSKFVGRIYRIVGKVSEAYPPDDGDNIALVVIETDIISKGMPFHHLISLCIVMSPEEFNVIGGVKSVGRQIDVSVELKEIVRNANPKIPEYNGYVVDLYFGELY